MTEGSILVIMWILTTLTLAGVQFVTLAVVVGLGISSYSRGEQIAEIRQQLGELRSQTGGRRFGDVHNSLSSGSGSTSQGGGAAASHGGGAFSD